MVIRYDLALSNILLGPGMEPETNGGSINRLSI